MITQDKIFCANAGDSRGVLNCGGEAIGLSEDHKPDNPEEIKRINKAGHTVEDARVDGNLALSRAFGDFQYKDGKGLDPADQAVSCYPDVSERERSPNDKFIVLACDGIWDCMTNERCVEYICDLTSKSKPKVGTCHKPVEEMLDSILAPDTSDGIGTDNMTAILIWFH